MDEWLDVLKCVTLDISQDPKLQFRLVSGVVDPKIAQVSVVLDAELIDPEPATKLIDAAKTRIDVQFPIVFSPNQLVPPTLSLGEVFAAGAGEFLAVVARLSNCPVSNLTVHANFWPSVVSGVADDQVVLERLIRVCAVIAEGNAAGVKGLKLRSVRTSAAPDAPKVKRARDNAIAWRVTVMKEGAGWRLHFWQIGSNQFEFESVRPKTAPVDACE